MRIVHYRTPRRDAAHARVAGMMVDIPSFAIIEGDRQTLALFADRIRQTRLK
jgi:hypothetical protein